MDLINKFIERRSKYFGELNINFSILNLTENEILKISSLITNDIIDDEFSKSNSNYSLFLGIYYLVRGYGSNENTKKYLLQSIDNGNKVASYMLAKYYMSQLHDWEWGYEGFHNDPDQKYYKYINMANEQDPDNVNILYDLGCYYGSCYNRNYKMKIKYLKKACELGHIKSMEMMEKYYKKDKNYHMELIYHNMIILTKDPSKRINKYNKLINYLKHELTNPFNDYISKKMMELIEFCLYYNFNLEELPENILIELKNKYFTILYNKEIVNKVYENIDKFEKILNDYEKHKEIITTIVKYSFT